MSLLNKIWNNSPKAVFQAFKRKIAGSNTTKPKWTEVKSGPLKGGKEFFKNHKPIIFMEVHNILMMFYVYKFLLKHGYSVKVLNENNSTLSRCFIMAQSV